MDRLWVCEEISCDGAAIRSYEDIAADGAPVCGCGSDMKLTAASCRDFGKVLRNKNIRL